MKILLNIIFCLVTFCSFGQVTGDIEKDTALANQYYQQSAKAKSHLETVELMKKAVELYEAHPFDKQILVIKGRIAEFLAYLQKFDEAEQFALSAIATADKELPNTPYPSSLANAYSALYRLYSRTRSADPMYCVSYGMKAMKCSGEQSDLYYRIAENIISRYFYYRKLEAMDSLIVAIETTLKTYPNPKNRLVVYRGKMLYFSALGNPEKALIYGQQLLTENEKYKSYPLFELSGIYKEMGNIYSQLKDFDQAIKWSNKELALKRKVLPKEHPEFGISYLHIGNLYGRNDEYEKAIENYKVAETYFFKDTISYASALSATYGNMTTLLIHLKKFKEAEVTLRKASNYMQTYEQTFMLGKVIGRQGNYKEGLKEIQKALILFSNQFNSSDINKNPSIYETYKDNKQAGLILKEKARLFRLWGMEENDQSKIEQSISTAALAVQLKERDFQTAKGFQKSRFNTVANMLSDLHLMMDGHYYLYQATNSPTNFEQLLYLSERRKAIQLIETLSENPLPPTLQSEQVTLEKNIQYYGQQLDLAMNRQQKDSIEYYQNVLFGASKAMESYLDKIKKDYPKESDAFYNTTYVSLSQIQEILSPQTLLLSYGYQEEEESYILTISDFNQKILKYDIEELQNKVKKFNELIQDRFAFQKAVREEFIDVSHELYKMLIAPIESELEGKTELRIVVEGHLFNLPFELLLPTNEKKPYHELDFLIKKYEINYHYSATAMLRLMEKETVRNNSILAFAPIFSKGDELTTATRSLDFMVDSLYQSIQDFEFVALPNTKTEVNTIAKMLKAKNGQTNVLLHKNATKTNFAQQLEKQSYQFVHIATHGLVNFKNPKLSALACFSKNETMDNLIYANEIQFKNINADLVVLSSCESGIGQLVQGEGLIALNRSFIYSGAKNVLFSLWKVNDKYSSELMIDFYKYYLDGQSYTTALRNAKLKMLANPTSAQPNFWAAFILMGQ